MTDTGIRMIFHLSQMSVFHKKTDVIENINIKHSVSENIRCYFNNVPTLTWRLKSIVYLIAIDILQEILIIIY